ncbi:MAG: hypothetical protein U5K37_09945 [Natrialbaceae archaeon]|nr:hypothetical protein [Natrialbaceae archaeon]
MTTVIQLESSAKDRLEELQAEIRLRTGQSVTQQELLSRLIEGADRASVIESFRESTVPLSEDEKAIFLERTIRSGVETDEADIDDSLYE